VRLRTCFECQRDVDQLRLDLCVNCYGRRRRRVGYRCTYVDADPIRKHLNMLLDSGANIHQIATASGVGSASIRYILKGREHLNQAPAARVSVKTAKALLSVGPMRRRRVS
jgi:hypothetical protein